MDVGISARPDPPLGPQVTAWVDSLLRTNLDHAVIFFSPEGAVVEWLGAAERLFGYTRAEALGLAIDALFTAEDRERGSHEQEMALARSVGRSEDDRWHVRRDGSRFWASGVLTAVRDSSGALVALCKIARDRTDLRMLHRAADNRARALGDELGRRARHGAAVLHELRGALSPLVSAAALLGFSADGTRSRDAVCVIGRQVEMLRRLVDDLREIERDAFPMRLIDRQRVEVGSALRESVETSRAAATRAGVHVTLVLPPAPIDVDADPLRLQQMVGNLIDNALKYTPRDGHVNVSASVEADTAVVRIEDDGYGIASEVLPRIFELFTRDARTPPVAGMGVGLAVVHDLARRHGGSVEARSAGPGKGSTFALRLPLHAPPASDDLSGTAP